jgi:ketol-acid reductoisomerase
MAENQRGRDHFNRWRSYDVDHPIEQVGKRLRQMMPFVSPKEVIPGERGP